MMLLVFFGGVLALGFCGLLFHIAMRHAVKRAAERGEHQARQALVAKLQAEVKQCTRALDAANRQLRDLSITDELTGAFNRCYFDDFCAQVLKHPTRREPLAFCMLDIDHFKSFNEILGHHAGDQALRAVTGALRAELRRSGDLLFRLGGEEFGVLFNANSPESAHQFVERLRRAVSELRISHPGSPSSIVTASFGVAWWDMPHNAPLTQDELHAHADHQLRDAKAAGRNRVSLAPL